ncbi:hypothetical protein CYMTET_53370 [Cymbomonas tetramitiformis]|uniref:Uncharacterized protein n=1 Tax=Cymbomonas tetramitiformis TaxID=36881 RepID=A0AAE0EPS7_9CHLO|nr:hypothetical protein CYMTET_53370 [Cymbomonas tetramitiformis]
MRECAAAYQAIVPAVQTQHALDSFLEAYGMEALEKLLTYFKEAELEAEWSAVVAMHHQIHKHPFHPQNQIPGKEVRKEFQSGSAKEVC